MMYTLSRHSGYTRNEQQITKQIIAMRVTQEQKHWHFTKLAKNFIFSIASIIT